MKCKKCGNEVVNHKDKSWQEVYEDFMSKLNSIIEIYV